MATIYWMAERKCYRIIKRVFPYMLFIQSPYLLAFFISIYCICVGNFDTSTYYLPMKIAQPFSVDSLFGWYTLCAFQFLCVPSYFGGTIIVVAYFACCCIYLEALCDHFDHLIGCVDAEFRENLNSPIARKVLINAIEHHVKIYE